MPKATLTFDLPEEQNEFDLATSGGAYAHLIWSLENEIFRPARKHGYMEGPVAELLAALDNLVEKYAAEMPDWPKDDFGPLGATHLIGLLEKSYYELKLSSDIKGE